MEVFGGPDKPYKGLTLPITGTIVSVLPLVIPKAPWNSLPEVGQEDVVD